MSGKKKRKRSLKTAAKHAATLAKSLKDDVPVIASVVLGDDNGLDNFEMRHYMKTMEGECVDGYMVYGADILQAP